MTRDYRTARTRNWIQATGYVQRETTAVSGGFTPDIVKIISKSQLLETECKHYDLFI